MTQTHLTTTFQTNLTDKTYNGWTNYETWNVALWIGNDEFLYSTAKACVEYCDNNETPYDKFIRCMMNCEKYTTRDNVRWDDDKINHIEVIEMMQDF